MPLPLYFQSGRTSGAKTTLAPCSAAISRVLSCELPSMTITSSSKPSRTLLTVCRIVPIVSSSSSAGRMKDTVVPSSFLRLRNWSSSCKKSLASKTPQSHDQVSGMLIRLPMTLGDGGTMFAQKVVILSSRLSMTPFTASTQPRGPTPLTRVQFLSGSASSQYLPSGPRTRNALSQACNMLRSPSASPRPMIWTASNLTSSKLRNSATASPLSMP
mmetsp:Transcript_43583/g.136351  ORF Transcript_43583/g.136351 Transcript_43583/m.136351 type:complete len:215 (-) Transcript_43583:689-1333(-)